MKKGILVKDRVVAIAGDGMAGPVPDPATEDDQLQRSDQRHGGDQDRDHGQDLRQEDHLRVDRDRRS